MRRLFDIVVIFQALWSLSSHAADQPAQSKVMMSVFYETLCPYSIDFIINDLNSTWTKLKDHVNITFVPYGSAKPKQDKNGKRYFTCQHGKQECLGNKIQACGLHYLPPNETVQFVICIMKHVDADKNSFTNYTEKCFNKSSEIEKLNTCINSEEGDNLIATNGDIMHAVKPKIEVVPSISFNGIFNKTVNDEASGDLLMVVCDLIHGEKPSPCADDE